MKKTDSHQWYQTKIMQNTISMVLVRGQALANIGQRVKLDGLIMIKGVKWGNTSVSE